jgi:O-antigen/teichoic acid export membrane protein
VRAGTITDNAGDGARATATALRPRATDVRLWVRSPAFRSSLGLIAGRVASMGLGFVAWLLAARVFPPADVGVASGLVSAMMLGVQLALLGIGSATIALYPSFRDDPGRLVNGGATSVVATAALVALGFVALAATISEELRVVAAPPLAAAFVAMTVFGTLNTYYDHVSIALHRGAQVLVRNVLFGIVTISVILVVAARAMAGGTSAIVAAWTAAGLVACLVAVWQLARAPLGLAPRPVLDRGLVARLVTTGLPNWILTLSERAPALLIPILVTELLSPATNAYWYATWMMAWVVLIIPISVGQTLFAQATQDPGRIGASSRRAVRTSLGLGLVGAAGMIVLADVALGLLGPSYAEAGTTPLRILVLSVLPFTLIQAYFAVCRARGSLREAIVTGIVGGSSAVVLTLAGGLAAGLVGMAVAWLGVQSAIGAWSFSRLRALTVHADPGE